MRFQSSLVCREGSVLSGKQLKVGEVQSTPQNTHPKFWRYETPFSLSHFITFSSLSSSFPLSLRFEFICLWWLVLFAIEWVSFPSSSFDLFAPFLFSFPFLGAIHNSFWRRDPHGCGFCCIFMSVMWWCWRLE